MFCQSKCKIFHELFSISSNLILCTQFYPRVVLLSTYYLYLCEQDESYRIVALCSKSLTLKMSIDF